MAPARNEDGRDYVPPPTHTAMYR